VRLVVFTEIQARQKEKKKIPVTHCDRLKFPVFSNAGKFKEATVSFFKP